MKSYRIEMKNLVFTLIALSISVPVWAGNGEVGNGTPNSKFFGDGKTNNTQPMQVEGRYLPCELCGETAVGFVDLLKLQADLKGNDYSKKLADLHDLDWATADFSKIDASAYKFIKHEIMPLLPNLFGEATSLAKNWFMEDPQRLWRARMGNVGPYSYQSDQERLITLMDRFPVQTSVDLLTTSLVDQIDPQVQCTILSFFEHHPNQGRGVLTVVQALASRNTSPNLCAIRALGYVGRGHSDATDFLLGLWQKSSSDSIDPVVFSDLDKMREIFITTTTALGDLKDKRVTPVLIEKLKEVGGKYLTETKEISTQLHHFGKIAAIIQALGKIGDPLSIGAIRPFVSCSDLSLLEVIATAFRDIDNPQSAKILADVLNESCLKGEVAFNWSIYTVLDAIGSLGDTGVLPKLEQVRKLKIQNTSEQDLADFEDNLKEFQQKLENAILKIKAQNGDQDGFSWLIDRIKSAASGLTSDDDLWSISQGPLKIRGLKANQREVLMNALNLVVQSSPYLEYRTMAFRTLKVLTGTSRSAVSAPLLKSHSSRKVN